MLAAPGLPSGMAGTRVMVRQFGEIALLRAETRYILFCEVGYVTFQATRGRF